MNKWMDGGWMKCTNEEMDECLNGWMHCSVDVYCIWMDRQIKRWKGECLDK